MVLASPYIIQVEKPDGTTPEGAYDTWKHTFEARLKQFSCGACLTPLPPCEAWAALSESDHDVELIEQEGPNDLFVITIYGGIVHRGCTDCD